MVAVQNPVFDSTHPKSEPSRQDLQLDCSINKRKGSRLPDDSWLTTVERCRESAQPLAAKPEHGVERNAGEWWYMGYSTETSSMNTVSH